MSLFGDIIPAHVSGQSLDLLSDLGEGAHLSAEILDLLGEDCHCNCGKMYATDYGVMKIKNMCVMKYSLLMMIIETKIVYTR